MEAMQETSTIVMVTGLVMGLVWFVVYVTLILVALIKVRRAGEQGKAAAVWLALSGIVSLVALVGGRISEFMLPYMIGTASLLELHVGMGAFWSLVQVLAFGMLIAGVLKLSEQKVAKDFPQQTGPDGA